MDYVDTKCKCRTRYRMFCPLLSLFVEAGTRATPHDYDHHDGGSLLVCGETENTCYLLCLNSTICSVYSKMCCSTFSQSIHPNPVHLHCRTQSGLIVAAPRGQPLLSTLPEVALRSRRIIAPRLLVRQRVRKVSRRTARRHADHEIELLIEGRIAATISPRILAGELAAIEVTGVRANGADMVAINAEYKVICVERVAKNQ